MTSMPVVNLIDGGISERIYGQESDETAWIFRYLCGDKFILSPRLCGELAGIEMQRWQAIKVSAGQNHALRNVSFVEDTHGVGGEDRGRVVGFQTLPNQGAQFRRSQVHMVVGAPDRGGWGCGLRRGEVGDWQS